MTATIRPYAPSDHRACLDIFDGNTPPFFDPTERQYFETFLQNDPSPYFVLEQHGRVVACGGLALYPGEYAGAPLSPERAGMKWGMVARDAHGQGLGTQLLNERINWLRARQPHVTHAILWTSQLTRPYYERQGFQVTHEVQDGIAPGLHRIDMQLGLH